MFRCDCENYERFFFFEIFATLFIAFDEEVEKIHVVEFINNIMQKERLWGFIAHLISAIKSLKPPNLRRFYFT